MDICNHARKTDTLHKLREINTMTGITIKEAVDILKIEDKNDIEKVFDRANAEREKYFGNKVSACSVVNARCGGCGEDCAFCAQSKHSSADVNYYSLISEDKMVDAGKKAFEDRAGRIGIVTSGRSVAQGEELDAICNAVKRISDKLEVSPCASLGLLSEEALKKLKSSGLKRYHHNLEAAESYFGKICGTRNYSDQIDTIKNAKNAGLEVCCGGIFGLGETYEQRVELLDTIRKLEVDSVPLNFLNPLPGTRLEKMDELTSVDCLKIIAVARLMMPDKSIRVCGGREYNLKNMQSEIFRAGANGLMVGGYLVTSGRPVKEDHKMIEDAGMELAT
jgi:biotin synthase